MYKYFKKSLFFVLVTFSIALVQPTIAMEENVILEKLNTVRTKIKNHGPVSEYPWETNPTMQTQGVLRTTIEGRMFDFCHTNYLGITKLNSELIQNKCVLKIPVDYVPYANININHKNININDENWFN